MLKSFEIAANGTPMGTFEAETAEDAILTYVRDAGYRDAAAMADVLGKTEEELIAELDVEEAA